jgi:hypothetical protein
MDIGMAFILIDAGTGIVSVGVLRIEVCFIGSPFQMDPKQTVARIADTSTVSKETISQRFTRQRVKLTGFRDKF